ncbi:peptide ABC transporter permease [Bifidobacterium margollesii]|uniref:Peptide ABC transporter permease n=2 Tax=Bifidobacterium margollesii TaxID=2020964 RepID=A0A2N5JC54_9BIFI|nr:peptide ABC transporter permease [Bifidobacterium margollesii]
MFVLKNAWSAMWRRWWRTLLLMLLALAVSFGSMIGLSVLKAETTATTTDYDKLTPAVTFRPDRETITEVKGKGDAGKVDWTKYRLSWNQYSEYVQKSGVQLTNAYYGETATVRLDRLKKTTNASDGADSITGKLADDTFAITGFSDENAAQDGLNGKYTIVDGEDLSYDENGAGQALVSEAFAKANDLKVGSTFTATNPSKTSTRQNLKVTGIYRNTGNVTERRTGLDPENTIYTNYYTMTVLGLSTTDQSGTSTNLDVAMILQSPSDYDKFVKAVRKAKLSNDYVIGSTTLDDYNAKVAPLKSLAAKIRPGLIVLAVAGAALAVLLLILGMRGRLEEVGFLTAIGVGRGGIANQFSLEALFPLLVGWAIGVAAAAFSVGPVSNWLTAGANASVDAGMIWTMVWIGIGVLVANAVICTIWVASIKTTTMLGSRMEA